MTDTATTGYVPVTPFGGKAAVPNPFALSQQAAQAKVLRTFMPNLPASTIAVLAADPLASQRTIAEQAGQMAGSTAASSTLASISSRPVTDQLQWWSTLTTTQRQAISTLGYSPPSDPENPHQGFLDHYVPHVVSAAMNMFYTPAKTILNPLWNSVRELGELGTEVYRKARQEGGLTQWLTLGGIAAGAVLGTAFGIATGGAGFAVEGAALAGLAAGTGIVTGFGAGVLAGGTAGYYAGQIQNTLSGDPSQWMPFVWGNDGESTWRPQDLEVAKAILGGDTALLETVKAAAFDSNADDISDDQLAAEVVKGLAGQRGGYSTEAVNKLVQRQLERRGIRPGTQEYEARASALQAAYSADPMMAMAKWLQTRKFSIGRDIAHTFGLDPSRGIGKIVSGAGDGIFVMVTDPLNMAGPLLESSRYVRFAMKASMLDDATSITNKGLHLLETEKGMLRFQEVAADILASDTDIEEIARRMPARTRHTLASLQEWGRRDALESGRALVWSPERVREGLRSNMMLTELLSGHAAGASSGWVMMPRIGSFQNGVRRIINPAELRAYVRGAADLRFTPAIDVGAEMGAAAHMANNIQNMRVVATDFTALVKLAWGDPEAPALLTRLAVGVLGAPEDFGPVRRATIGRAAGLFQQLATPTMRRSFISIGADLASTPQGRRDLTGFIEQGRWAGISAGYRDTYMKAIMEAENNGVRRSLIRSYAELMLKASGADLTPGGMELLDTVIRKKEQVFAGVQATLRTNMAEHVALPSFYELRKEMRKGLFNQVLGSVESSAIMSRLDRIWKPAVLLRGGFIVRAVAEELANFVFRAGWAALPFEAAARGLAKADAAEARRLTAGGLLGKGDELFGPGRWFQSIYDHTVKLHLTAPLNQTAAAAGKSVRRVLRAPAPADVLPLRFNSWLSDWARRIAAEGFGFASPAKQFIENHPKLMNVLAPVRSVRGYMVRGLNSDPILMKMADLWSTHPVLVSELMRQVSSGGFRSYMEGGRVLEGYVLRSPSTTAHGWDDNIALQMMGDKWSEIMKGDKGFGAARAANMSRVFTKDLAGRPDIAAAMLAQVADYRPLLEAAGIHDTVAWMHQFMDFADDLEPVERQVVAATLMYFTDPVTQATKLREAAAGRPDLLALVDHMTTDVSGAQLTVESPLRRFAQAKQWLLTQPADPSRDAMLGLLDHVEPIMGVDSTHLHRIQHHMAMLMAYDKSRPAFAIMTKEQAKLHLADAVRLDMARNPETWMGALAAEDFQAVNGISVARALHPDEVALAAPNIPDVAWRWLTTATPAEVANLALGDEAAAAILERARFQAAQSTAFGRAWLRSVDNAPFVTMSGASSTDLPAVQRASELLWKHINEPMADEAPTMATLITTRKVLEHGKIPWATDLGELSSGHKIVSISPVHTGQFTVWSPADGMVKAWNDGLQMQTFIPGVDPAYAMEHFIDRHAQALVDTFYTSPINMPGELVEAPMPGASMHVLGGPQGPVVPTPTQAAARGTAAANAPAPTPVPAAATAPTGRGSQAAFVPGPTDRQIPNFDPGAADFDSSVTADQLIEEMGAAATTDEQDAVLARHLAQTAPDEDLPIAPIERGQPDVVAAPVTPTRDAAIRAGAKVAPDFGDIPPNAPPEVQGAVAMFTTDKGSKYYVLQDGSTTRWKAPGIHEVNGVDDTGWKAQSTRTFYFPSTEDYAERYDQIQAAKGRPSRITLGPENDVPAVGKSPIEVGLTDDGRRWTHPGHPIDSVTVKGGSAPGDVPSIASEAQPPPAVAADGTPLPTEPGVATAAEPVTPAGEVPVTPTDKVAEPVDVTQPDASTPPAAAPAAPAPAAPPAQETPEQILERYRQLHVEHEAKEAAVMATARKAKSRTEFFDILLENDHSATVAAAGISDTETDWTKTIADAIADKNKRWGPGPTLREYQQSKLAEAGVAAPSPGHAASIAPQGAEPAPRQPISKAKGKAPPNRRVTEEADKQTTADIQAQWAAAHPKTAEQTAQDDAMLRSPGFEARKAELEGQTLSQEEALAARDAYVQDLVDANDPSTRMFYRSELLDDHGVPRQGYTFRTVAEVDADELYGTASHEWDATRPYLPDKAAGPVPEPTVTAEGKPITYTIDDLLDDAGNMKAEPGVVLRYREQAVADMRDTVIEPGYKPRPIPQGPSGPVERGMWIDHRAVAEGKVRAYDVVMYDTGEKLADGSPRYRAMYVERVDGTGKLRLRDVGVPEGESFDDFAARTEAELFDKHVEKSLEEHYKREFDRLNGPRNRKVRAAQGYSTPKTTPPTRPMLPDEMHEYFRELDQTLADFVNQVDPHVVNVDLRIQQGRVMWHERPVRPTEPVLLWSRPNMTVDDLVRKATFRLGEVSAAEMDLLRTQYSTFVAYGMHQEVALMKAVDAVRINRGAVPLIAEADQLKTARQAEAQILRRAKEMREGETAKATARWMSIPKEDRQQLAAQVAKDKAEFAASRPPRLKAGQRRAPVSDGGIYDDMPGGYTSMRPGTGDAFEPDVFAFGHQVDTTMGDGVKFSESSQGYWGHNAYERQRMDDIEMLWFANQGTVKIGDPNVTAWSMDPGTRIARAIRSIEHNTRSFFEHMAVNRIRMARDSLGMADPILLIDDLFMEGGDAKVQASLDIWLEELKAMPPGFAAGTNMRSASIGWGMNRPVDLYIMEGHVSGPEFRPMISEVMRNQRINRVVLVHRPGVDVNVSGFGSAHGEVRWAHQEFTRGTPLVEVTFTSREDMVRELNKAHLRATQPPAVVILPGTDGEVGKTLMVKPRRTALKGEVSAEQAAADKAAAEAAGQVVAPSEGVDVGYMPVVDTSELTAPGAVGGGGWAIEGLDSRQRREALESTAKEEHLRINYGRVQTESTPDWHLDASALRAAQRTDRITLYVPNRPVPKPSTLKGEAEKLYDSWAEVTQFPFVNEQSARVNQLRENIDAARTHLGEGGTHLGPQVAPPPVVPIPQLASQWDSVTGLDESHVGQAVSGFFDKKGATRGEILGFIEKDGERYVQIDAGGGRIILNPAGNTFQVSPPGQSFTDLFGQAYRPTGDAQRIADEAARQAEKAAATAKGAPFDPFDRLHATRTQYVHSGGQLRIGANGGNPLFQVVDNRLLVERAVPAEYADLPQLKDWYHPGGGQAKTFRPVDPPRFDPGSRPPALFLQGLQGDSTPLELRPEQLKALVKGSDGKMVTLYRFEFHDAPLPAGDNQALEAVFGTPQTHVPTTVGIVENPEHTTAIDFDITDSGTTRVVANPALLNAEVASGKLDLIGGRLYESLPAEADHRPPLPHMVERGVRIHTDTSLGMGTASGVHQTGAARGRIGNIERYQETLARRLNARTEPVLGRVGADGKALDMHGSLEVSPYSELWDHSASEVAQWEAGKPSLSEAEAGDRVFRAERVPGTPRPQPSPVVYIIPFDPNEDPALYSRIVREAKAGHAPSIMLVDAGNDRASVIMVDALRNDGVEHVIVTPTARRQQWADHVAGSYTYDVDEIPVLPATEAMVADAKKGSAFYAEGVIRVNPDQILNEYADLKSLVDSGGALVDPERAQRFTELTGTTMEEFHAFFDTPEKRLQATIAHEKGHFAMRHDLQSRQPGAIEQAAQRTRQEQEAWAWAFRKLNAPLGENARYLPRAEINNVSALFGSARQSIVAPGLEAWVIDGGAERHTELVYRFVDKVAQGAPPNQALAATLDEMGFAGYNAASANPLPTAVNGAPPMPNRAVPVGSATGTAKPSGVGTVPPGGGTVPPGPVYAVAGGIGNAPAEYVVPEWEMLQPLFSEEYGHLAMVDPSSHLLAPPDEYGPFAVAVNTAIPVDPGLMARMYTYGFGRVIGPTIDKLSRTPIAFHEALMGYRQASEFRAALRDPAFWAAGARDVEKVYLQLQGSVDGGFTPNEQSTVTKMFNPSVNNPVGALTLQVGGGKPWFLTRSGDPAPWVLENRDQLVAKLRTIASPEATEMAGVLSRYDITQAAIHSVAPEAQGSMVRIGARARRGQRSLTTYSKDDQAVADRAMGLLGYHVTGRANPAATYASVSRMADVDVVIADEVNTLTRLRNAAGITPARTAQIDKHLQDLDRFKDMVVTPASYASDVQSAEAMANWFQGLEKNQADKMLLGLALKGDSQALRDLNKLHRFGMKLTKADLYVMKDAAQNLARVESGIFDLAMARGATAALPFIDRDDIRTEFSAGLHRMFPFFNAEEQFVKRWARTLWENPEVARKVQLTVQGLRSGGMIRKDENGDDYFVYPGSSALVEVLAKIPGLGTMTPMANVLTGKLTMTLPGLERFGVPNVTPWITMPLRKVAAMFPEFGQYITPSLDAASDPRASRLGDLRSVVPVQLTRFFDALLANEGSSKVSSAMMSAASVLQANGHGLPENATPAQVQEYHDRLRTHTRTILLAQAIGGFFLPAAPTPGVVQGDQPGSFDSPWALKSLTGVDSVSAILGPKYFELVRTYGLEQGTRIYQKLYPDHDLDEMTNQNMAYTVSRTISPSGRPIPITEQAIAHYDANADYYNAHPYGGPWLLPPMPPDESDTKNNRLYADVLARKMRVKKTPEEFMRSAYFAAHSDEYFATTRMYDDQLQATTDIQTRRTITANKQMWRDDYLAAHPLFAEEIRSGEGRNRRTKVLEDMGKMMADPTSVPTGSNAGGIFRLTRGLALFRSARAALEGRGDAEAVAQRDDLDTRFQLWGDAQVQGDASLGSYWNGVIKVEANL